MIEPTDNEIIMFISVAKAIEQTVKSPDKRKKILEAIPRLIEGYNRLPKESKDSVVNQFKSNIQKMNERITIKDKI